MTSPAAIRTFARDWRGPLRRLGLGLSTLFGLGSRGYFIPYRYAADVRRQGANYVALESLFDRRQNEFASMLEAIESFGEILKEIERADSHISIRPRWQQDWFPPLDAAVAYTLVRTLHPQRIVEIGSGHSTRFLLRAIQDGGLPTRLSAIDPEPRADLPRDGLEICRATLQDTGPGPFRHLAAGDFLVVDSSHVLMPGSDVDIIVNAILPQLPAGTYVHFHDIFLPDDYPHEWRWRSYNEQSVVAALLQSGAYSPLYSSHYVATRMREALARSVVASLPRLVGARDSSLWLVKGPSGLPST